MSGLQIKYALDFAEYVRAQGVSSPLMWGGIHPTLLPEQTAKEDLVDIVVRGEGELIVKNLAICLASGGVLGDVAGLTYKSEGKIEVPSTDKC